MMVTQLWREDIPGLSHLPKTADADTGKVSSVEGVLGIKAMSMASVECDKATTPSRHG